MGKCIFQTSWLTRTDCNGVLISAWASRKSDSEAFCKLYLKTFSVVKGFEKLIHHAKGEKHRECSRTSLIPSQLHLSLSLGSESKPSTSAAATIKLYNTRDNSSVAELIWVLKCVSSDYSFSSCTYIKETFSAMFPESAIDNFSLSRTKATYIITDHVAPVFRQQQLKEIEDTPFTLCYDETVNVGGRKELQTILSFWSKSENKVVCRHLQTFYIGSATGNDIFSKLNEAMENACLSRKNLIMLGSDGPNVNKKVFRLMNSDFIHERKKPLLDIGTCNIHILHNAYQHALDKLGDSASELIISVYHFFKDWPSRCDDYIAVQQKQNVPCHRFIKHVPSRWLTMEEAATRVLEQWNALNEYFLKFVPTKKSSLLNKPRYMKITKLLKMPSLKAEILFAVSSCLQDLLCHFSEKNHLSTFCLMILNY